MGIDLTGWAARLLDEVCALIGGVNAVPPDEPADARRLGEAWGAMANVLETGLADIVELARRIFANWPDNAGHAFLDSVTSYAADLAPLITSCREMAAFCEQYARDVHLQRMATRVEMLINAAAFALAFTGGGALAGAFARQVASNVAKRIATAALRTAAAGRSRTAVTSVAVNLGRGAFHTAGEVVEQVTREMVEEGVISAVSQKLSQEAGYNPGGIDSQRFVTDTVAGGIGGALGYGPGKAITKVIKPTGVVSQHAAAALTGGGLNAFTSPISSTAAHDLVVHQSFSGFDEYGRNIRENAVDAGRMGLFRANGTVASSQLGSLAGLHGSPSATAPDVSLANPEGPPPPPTGTPASPAASETGGGGIAGDGAQGAQQRTAPEQAANQQGSTEQAASRPTAGQAGATAESAGATSTEHQRSGTAAGGGRESTVATSAEPGRTVTSPGETGAHGKATSAQPAGDHRAATTESSTAASRATESSGTESSGTESSGAESSNSTASATTESATSNTQSADTSAGSEEVASPPAATTETSTAPTTAATTAESAPAGSPATPGVVVTPAGTSTRATTQAQRSAPATTMGSPASTATGEAAATTTRETRRETRREVRGAPPELPAAVWRQLSPPVREAVTTLFRGRNLRQSIKNAVAKLAPLDVPEATRLRLIGLADTLNPTVLSALVEIAERATTPAALEVASTLAELKRLGANNEIRKIRDLLRQNSPELSGLLARYQDPEAATPAAEALSAPVAGDTGVLAPIARPTEQETEQETEREPEQVPMGVDPWSGVIAPATESHPEPATVPEPTPAEEAVPARVDVGSGVIAPVGDLVPSGDTRPPPGFDVGSGLISPFAEPGSPDAVEQAAPNGTPPEQTAEPDVAEEPATEQAVVTPVGLGPGLIAAPSRQPLLFGKLRRASMLAHSRVVPQEHATRIAEVARAALRGADHIAGMASVRPTADPSVFHVTDTDGTAATVTVRAGDQGSTIGASYVTDGRSEVRIAVSTRARPGSVPALVAAALAEAVAELSGRHAQLEDHLAEDGSADSLLSVRDRGRSAQLLAYDYVLQRNPFHFGVRSQLNALISELGLEPRQSGADSRLKALPERTQDVVRRRTTTLDGLPDVASYLVRSIGSALPTAVILGLVALVTPALSSFAIAMIATSLARALTLGYHDRSVQAREDAASTETFAGHKLQLDTQRRADLGQAFMRGLVGLRSPTDARVTAPPPPRQARVDSPLVHRQWERIYAVRRYTGAVATTAALASVMVLTATAPFLDPLLIHVALGILAATVMQAVANPVLEAGRRRYILPWKADRKHTLLSRIDRVLTGQLYQIAAAANGFDEKVHRALPDMTAERFDRGKPADRWKFWYNEAIAGQGGRIMVPQSAEKVRRDPDPNDVAGSLHLWVEYLDFRVSIAAFNYVMSVLFGASQFTAGQDALLKRSWYDKLNDATLDRDAFAAAIAAATARIPASVEQVPLAEDENRPSGLASRKWYGVATAKGMLMAAIASGFNQLLGMPGIAGFYAMAAFGPLADATTTRRIMAKELTVEDAAAERGRPAAQSARDSWSAALREFKEHVLGTTGIEQRTATEHPLADRILAALDAAYAALVEQARDLVDRPEASLDELGETLVDRLTALRSVAGAAEKLAAMADSVQPRAEVVARDGLVSAIQKYNAIPGVDRLPLAGLVGGVHASTADESTVDEVLPELPTLPPDVDGQVAAVAVDQHLRGAATPDREFAELAAFADVAALAGNEAWAARVAAAAGVPDREFRPMSTINDIVGRLTRLGDGSRAIVHAQRKDDHAVAESGDLLNAVNIGGEVFFLEPATGTLADVSGYTDGLSMLLTQDNGEHAGVMAGARLAPLLAAAARARHAYPDRVLGSLLHDPAAPGLPAPVAPTGLGAAVSRIASVINPSAGNAMPSIHAYSDQWDWADDHWPAPVVAEIVAGLGVSTSVARLVTAMLATFGGAEVTGTPEYRRLAEVLGRDEALPSDLFAAMTGLLEALLANESALPDAAVLPDDGERPARRDTVDPTTDPTGGPDHASTVADHVRRHSHLRRGSRGGNW